MKFRIRKARSCDSLLFDLPDRPASWWLDVPMLVVCALPHCRLFTSGEYDSFAAACSAMNEIVRELRRNYPNIHILGVTLPFRHPQSPNLLSANQ